MASVVAAQQPTLTSKPKETARSALLKHPALLSFFLALATVALYSPVHHHPFINYDDNEYVYQNPQVLSGLSWTTMKWSVTTTSAANWHPATWLAHAAVCEVFGADPAGHHDANVVLHALDVVLLFWVLFSATGFAGRSFAAAALFALHPINVESVAWVAELKTLLSMFFFLLALGAYGRYVRRPRPAGMAVVSSAFACGLMAKPQIITLPIILLLWDYWPLRRMAWSAAEYSGTVTSGQVLPDTLRNLINEKRPLFILSAASAVLTLHAQQHARIWYPPSARVGNAILSYGLYIRKALWPSNLALLYPHPTESLPWIKVTCSAVVLLSITLFVILNRRHRYLFVGWFWFLVTLVPMLGLVQVGVQAMADRYAYVSFIGLFIMVCWGVPDSAEKNRVSPAMLAGAAAMVLLALGITSRRQINYWGAEEDLWRHTLQVTGPNWVAESELGAFLAMRGRVTEAVPHFNNALVINPNDVSSNMGLAIYELQTHNFLEAIRHYSLVVKQPLVKAAIMQQAYLGLAKSYKAMGDSENSHAAAMQARTVNKP
jgi:protein O-mannosyl-transferase